MKQKTKGGILFDSGAYSAYTKKQTINFDEFVQFIRDFGHRFDGYFTLDIVNDGKKSYDNWIELRRLGLNPIPIYHMGTDIKYLKRYLDETDYIALSVVKSKNSAKRIGAIKELWNKYFLDLKTQKLKYKIHGLGATSTSLLTSFPWFSVDSTAAVLIAAYGRIMFPMILKEDFSKINYSVIKNVSVSTNNPSLSHVWSTQKGRIMQEFIEQKGFDLGNMFYHDKQLTRREKTNQKRITTKSSYFFDFSSLKKANEEKTLAHDTYCRILWNIMMFDHIVQKACKEYQGLDNIGNFRPLVYHVITTGVLKEIYSLISSNLENIGTINLLLSYYYINNSKLLSPFFDFTHS